MTYIRMKQGFIMLVNAAGCWPARPTLRLTPLSDSRFLESSTPIKVASSQQRASPRPSYRTAADSHKRQGRDNPFVKRLRRTINYERVRLRAYDGVGVVRVGLNQWHSIERSHNHTDNETPAQAYWALLPTTDVAA